MNITLWVLQVLLALAFFGTKFVYDLLQAS